MWMLFSSLIFPYGSPNAGNLLLRRKWYPMSQNSKINKTLLLSDKRIPKSLPFTTSSSSFYSGTGTILYRMNFVCDIELVLDLNLSRQIQQAAVPMGMLCLHGKCWFRDSYKHKQKRKKKNLHGEGECPGPCYIVCAAALEGFGHLLLMHRSDAADPVMTTKPRQPDSAWLSHSQPVSWTETCSGPQSAGKIFTYTAETSYFFFCLNLTQNLCTEAQEIWEDLSSLLN